jgi:hypothetical protein
MLNEVNLRSDLKGIHPGCTNHVPAAHAQPPRSAPPSLTYTKLGNCKVRGSGILSRGHVTMKADMDDDSMNE